MPADTANEIRAVKSLLRLRNRTLDLSGPLVMGVLNVTPDSFSDGGRIAGVDAAVDAARRMLEEGAALIDVGGESTRPGAAPVTETEELRRVVPVIERLVGELGCVVSVDTMKPAVMRAACAAGAELINDVNALRVPGALEAVLECGAAVCLMHMQGEPRTMQQAPHYGNVVAEVEAFLRARIECCRQAGIADDAIVVDPGFGFGKRLEHNIALFAGLRRLTELGYPLMVGVSRKSMLGELTGRPIDQRQAAGVAAAALAVAAGARIVRTHDVASTFDAVRVAAALSGGATE